MIPTAFELFAKMLLTKPIGNQNTHWVGGLNISNNIDKKEFQVSVSVSLITLPKSQKEYQVKSKNFM